MGKKHKKHQDSAPADAQVQASGPPPKMKNKEYEQHMRVLQGELVAMQEWVKASGAKICIVFEGLDSAGKGGTIRRITERTSPRVFKHIALPAPTEREKSQMYVQRYMAHFPSAGEVAIFDRSWYNRAGVEPVMGYCTQEQTDKFLEHAPTVEKAMVDNGIILLKYWLNVSVARADPAAGQPDRRPAQGVEAVPDGPEVIQPPLPVLPGAGRDARSHGHVLGAVVRGGQRRQEARPAEHHLAPAQPDPVRAAAAVADEDAQEADPPRVRRARHAAAPHPDTVLSRRGMESNACETERREATREEPTMTQSEAAADTATSGAEQWFALSGDEVVQRLGVDPAQGLSAGKAAELLKQNGPNALPAEKPAPGWRRFLAQYKSYMQIILVGAAVASILIGQVTTGLVVLLITALNALGGLRQQGKAESAMNALQSMLKTSARVRRDGTEVKVDADQVVVGDVVLLSAGDDVCADGRLLEATSLQIDESALTGESVPASKSVDVITDPNPVLGDQVNMAFMNTPVTHGSGVMIITGTGADTAVGKISGMLKSAPTLKTPLTAQLDTLTLWIAGAAGLTIAIMFALGISRGDSTQVIFTTAIALALAAVPMAMPTVLQVILSTGSTKLAKHGAVVKSLDSVETLGSTSAINSDKTGTLTMNQVTVVEVIDPTDRYAVTGMGYGLDGQIEHTVGNTNTIEAAILPFLICNDAKLVGGKVVGDPTEGALLVLGHKAKVDAEGTQEQYPRLATLPFDPTYKFMAVFCQAKDASGNPVVRVFVKGAGPAVIAKATSALANGEEVAWTDDATSARTSRCSGSAARVCG